MLPNIAEYLNINVQYDLLNYLFSQCETNFNTFGKTDWVSYSLEDNKTGRLTKYHDLFQPIVDIHRQVHPYIQTRSTGFNTADQIGKDVFAHTDVDFDQEHPNHYNLVIPIIGESVIEYFDTRPSEVYLPEKNVHGFAYYHEFKNRNEPGYDEFLKQRKIGEILVNGPILLDTTIMHRVVATVAPRVAWVTRWNNIPAEVGYREFKNRVEEILK